MSKLVRKAVFPVAGMGTRMLPASKSLPKELLPVVDKPLIQYAVEETVACGFDSVIFVTARGKSRIEDHFDRAPELEDNLHLRGQHEIARELRLISEMTRVSYVRQAEASGAGDAILQARALVGDEPFALVLSDDLFAANDSPIKRMMEIYEKYRAPVLCAMQVEREAVSRFGVLEYEEVEGDVIKVLNVVEKPSPEDAPSDMVAIGRYILTPDIFGELERTKPDKNGEIQAADAMCALLKKRPFYALRFTGKHYDAGDKLGYLTAIVEFALQRPELAAPFAEYLRHKISHEPQK